MTSYLWFIDVLANTAEAVWRTGWSVYDQAKHKQDTPQNMIITEESRHVNTLKKRRRFHADRWNPFKRYEVVSRKASGGSRQTQSHLGGLLL